MVRKLMAVAAVSGLMMTTALAQSNTNQAAGKSAGNVQAITSQSPDQWLGSTLIGMTVVDPSDNSIGEVNDLLVDKSGKIEALIVGVGGFLGMGERRIALPMSAFSIVSVDRSQNTTGAGSATSGTDRLRLSMTNEQLQQHAEFRSNNNQTTGAGSGASPDRSTSQGGGSMMAPRNNNPPAGTAR